MKPESAQSKLPKLKLLFRGPIRILAVLLTLFAIVVFVFPLIFRPVVEPPEDLRFASPFSVPVRISNRNMTPLKDVEYVCEIAKLTLANGSEVNDAKVLIRGTIRSISGRRAVMGRCQTADITSGPLQAAEYKLTVTYRAYPWPRRRTTVYRIVAQISNDGQVESWKVTRLYRATPRVMIDVSV
jgi:hypothetical protein